MSRSTISTFKLFELFPDAETARKHLESRLWPNGPICPKCKLTGKITVRKGGYYRCNPCSFDFTVRTGTIFGRSHIALHKWIYAMYLLATARKGISSMQLAKEIGIRQASAWFMLQRLREACAGDSSLLKGIVEVDEIYIGGREEFKHMRQRLNFKSSGTANKTPIIGMRERKGRTRALPIEGTNAFSLIQAVRQNVEQGATIQTDEYQAYRRLRTEYKHEAVNHRLGIYSRNGVTTNGIESVFAVLRRGLHGVYHKASQKHIHRYVNEFAWRLNEGNVKRHSLERLESFIKAVVGRRLSYQSLIAPNGKNPVAQEC